MNDLIEKVKQGLRCHSKSGKCSGSKNPCPYWDVYCIPATCTDALSVIEEMEQEIERLKGYINGFSKNAIIPVRCKDCKYYGKTMGSCAKLDGYDYMPDFYCACGERKEGDPNG